MNEKDKVSEYADRIMTQIHADMQQPFPWGKQIPPNVGSFSALHDYLDANEYLLDFCPDESAFESTDAWIEFGNKVSNEVDKRLRAEAGLKDVWIAFGPGYLIGSWQLYHPWSTIEQAMEECQRIAGRPLDWVESHGGERFTAEGKRTPSGAFSGPYMVVRQTLDGTDAQTHHLS